MDEELGVTGGFDPANDPFGDQTQDQGTPLDGFDPNTDPFADSISGQDRSADSELFASPPARAGVSNAGSTPVGFIQDQVDPQTGFTREVNQQESDALNVIRYSQEQFGLADEDFDALTPGQRAKLVSQAGMDYFRGKIEGGERLRDTDIRRSEWWVDNMLPALAQAGSAAAYRKLTGAVKPRQISEKVRAERAALEGQDMSAILQSREEELTRKDTAKKTTLSETERVKTAPPIEQINEALAGYAPEAQKVFDEGDATTRYRLLSEAIRNQFIQRNPSASQKDVDDWMKQSTTKSFIAKFSNAEFYSGEKTRYEESKKTPESPDGELKKADTSSGTSWWDSFRQSDQDAANAVNRGIGSGLSGLLYAPVAARDFIGNAVGGPEGLAAVKKYDYVGNYFEAASDWISSRTDQMVNDPVTGFSAEAKAERAALGEKVQSGDWTGAAKEIVTNPSLMVNTVAESLGFTIGAGGIAGGTRAAATTMLGKGATVLAAGAPATVAAVGSVAKDMDSMFDKMTPEEFAMLPAYQDFKAANPQLSHDKLAAMTRAYGNKLAIGYGTLGGITGLMFGSATENLALGLATKTVTGGVIGKVKEVVKKTAVEAAGEFVQGGSEQAAEEILKKGYTKEAVGPILAGGVVEGVAGGATAGGLSLASTRSGPAAATPLPPANGGAVDGGSVPPVAPVEGELTGVATPTGEPAPAAPVVEPTPDSRPEDTPSPKDVATAKEVVIEAQKQVMAEFAVDDNEVEAVEASRRNKVMASSEGLDNEVLVSAPFEEDSDTGVDAVAKKSERGRASVANLANFKADMKQAKSIKEQASITMNRLKTVVNRYDNLFGADVDPAVRKTGVYAHILGTNSVTPEIADKMAEAISGVDGPSARSAIESFLTSQDPAEVEVARGLLEDYNFQEEARNSYNELFEKANHRVSAKATKKRSNASMEAELRGTVDKAIGLAGREKKLPPFVDKRYLNVVPIPADQAAKKIIDRINPALVKTPKTDRIKARWMNNYKPMREVRGPIDFMNQLQKRTARLIDDGMDSFSFLRRLDNVAKAEIPGWTEDLKTHSGAFRGTGRALTHSSILSHKMEIAARTIDSGVTATGLSVDEYKANSALYAHALDAPNVIKYIWLRSTDHFKALNKAGKARHRAITESFENNRNLNDADVLAWEAQLTALYADPALVNDPTKIVPLKDVTWNVNTPSGLVSLDFDTATAITKEFNDRGYGKSFQATADAVADMTKALRQAQRDSNILATPQNNLVMLARRKYYLPNSGKDSDDDFSRDLGFDIEANLVNKQYRAMATISDKAKIEADYISNGLVSADPYAKLAGMATHAAQTVAQRGLFDSLAPVLKALNRPTVGMVKTVAREYDESSGKHYYSLPGTQDGVDFIHRLDDGNVNVITIGQRNASGKLTTAGQEELLETIVSFLPKKREEGPLALPYKALRTFSQYQSRMMTSNNLEFAFGMSLVRDGFEATATSMNELGVRGGLNTLKNAGRSMMTRAVPLYRFYVADDTTKQTMLARMKADPVLKYTAMRYETGGSQSFRDELGGARALREVDFANKTNGLTKRLASLVDYVDGVATTMDNMYRDAVFATMVEGGMSVKKAEDTARNVINHRQKAGNESAQKLLGLYSFAASGVTGVHTMLTRRIWKGNDMPTRTSVSPNGDTLVSLDWAKVPSSLSYPVVGGYAAMGIGNTLLTAMMLGAFSESDDENEFSRLDPSRFIRSYVLPFGTDEEGHSVPYSIPMQYGVQSVMSGMGALAVMSMFGTHPQEDINLAAAELFTANFIPIGNLNPDEMYDVYKRKGISGLARNLAVSASPTGVSALTGAVLNRSTFGNELFSEQGNTLQPRLEDDGLSRAYGSTAPIWKEIGKMFTDLADNSDAAKGPVDALNLTSPEVNKFLADQYLPLVGYMDKIYRAVNRAAENPEYNMGRFMTDIVPLPGSSVTDSVNYEQRMVDKTNADYQFLERERLQAAHLDSREDGTVGTRKNGVGAREKAWREDNPTWGKMKPVFDEGFKKIRGINEKRTELLDKGDYEGSYAATLESRKIYIDMHTKLKTIVGDDD